MQRRLSSNAGMSNSKHCAGRRRCFEAKKVVCGPQLEKY